MVLLQCTKHEAEPPFFDGLYLKYHEVFGNEQEYEHIRWTRDIVYRFKQAEDGNFHISQRIDTQKGKGWKLKIEPMPYPEAGEDLTVDKKGIVLRGGDNFNFPNGYPSYLWLPSSKRRNGAVVIEIIRRVGEKTIWKGCEVWPVTGALGDTHYYDVNTGILVGAESIRGRLKLTLVDTNLEALKEVLPK